MKNSLNLSFNRLSNHDFGGFMNRVINSTASITAEGIEELIGKFNESIVKFNSVIADFTLMDAKHKVSILDSNRTKAFVSFRNQVKLLRNFPNGEVNELGNEIWKVIKAFDNIRDVNQNSTTDVFESVIGAVKSLTSETRFKSALKSSGIEIWFTQLEKFHKEYIDADQIRSDERINRLNDSVRLARERCATAYRKLICFVEFNAIINNDENSKEFISKVEGFVEDCRRLLRVRSNRKKKNSEPDSKAETERSVDAA